jgi:hypothetical protein
MADGSQRRALNWMADWTTIHQRLSASESCLSNGRGYRKESPGNLTGVKILSTKEKQAPVRDIADVLSRGIHQGLFPAHLELVPQLNEVYELELAFYESQIGANSIRIG